MKPRRSKRLSKSPAVKDNENSDLENIGKKQKLEQQQHSLPIDKSNENISSKEEVYRKGFDSQCKSSNGNDSDSSDSSVDYMKSPQTLDLDSDFFKVDFRKGGPSSEFSAIENKIFSEVQHLSDSEGSSSDEDCKISTNFPIPLVFRQFADAESVKSNALLKAKQINKKRVKSKTGSKGTIKSSIKKIQKGSVKIKPEDENVDLMDVSELLALGEAQPSNGVKKKEILSASEEEEEEEEEMTDWEEVRGEESKEVKQEKHSFPKDGVQITVDAPDLYHKRKKKEFDMAAFVKRRMNQVKREQQILIHKVHLLCWIAHGLHVNSVLNSEELMGLSLSLIPSQHSYPNKVNESYLKKICGWFFKNIPAVEIASEKASSIPLLQSLQKQFASGTAQSHRDLVLMFVCLLRSLGITTRFIISLQPLPLKPANSDLSDSKLEKPKLANKKENKGEKRVEKKVLAPDEARQLQKKVLSKEEAIKRLKSVETDGKIKISPAKKLRVEQSTSAGKQFNCEQSRSLRAKKNMKNKYDSSSTSDDEAGRKEVVSSTNEDYSDEVGRENSQDKTSHRRSTNCKLLEKASTKKCSSNEKKQMVAEKYSHSDNIVAKKDRDSCLSSMKLISSSFRIKKVVDTKKISKKVVSEDKVSLESISKKSSTSKKSLSKEGKLKVNTQMKKENNSACTSQTSEDEFIPQTQNHRKSASRKRLIEEKHNMKKDSSKSESESDFEHELTTKMKQARSITKNGIDRRVLSSDSDDSVDNNKRIGNDFWAEVLVDSEQWIPVDVITGEVNCPGKLFKRATKPVTYIVAWNPDMSLKDITRKYCTQFHSLTRKQRIDEKWWREALFPFLSPNTARDKKEDEDMQKQIQEQPLPTSIAEYKNHPLYALKRHLLKFQAIYPPDAPTLGFVKGEPVYARECVHTLHSRDIWLKEAKVVRLREKPYKIVKARPKWDRMSGKVITDLPLEIYGAWQVDDYVPPTAIDGKVPRNAYGNVELFKPSMLPKGTIHLQVPGLNRVAKKLQIDCAPAVVGFDFHCGASHPMYDGFVVCEEFQDVLLDAWNRDQEEAERREQEKRDKRVYGNWRRLIKGLLIRERLKVKYAFGESEPSTSKSKNGKKK